MAKTIAIVNQKGGVGKTTTCVNLAAALTEAGQRILLCDFDPQANSTSGMGVDKTVSKGIYDALIGEVPVEDAWCTPNTAMFSPPTRRWPARDRTDRHGAPGIPSAGRAGQGKRSLRLPVHRLPPSLELLTLNASAPRTPSWCRCRANTTLWRPQRSDEHGADRPQVPESRLELDGVLLTMFDGRTNLALQVAEEVKHYFPGKVYATVIPRNVRLSEAPSHGKPITAYDRTSRGAEAYTAFAAEFLKKQSA